MKAGCYTALITPFDAEGAVDGQGLKKLVDFQIDNGITGIIATGTTGESPTLQWEEHNRVVAEISGHTREKCLCIAGAGSNNTKEALEAVEHAVKEKVDGVLMVDPYYNGPSSTEIRKEYYTPVAEAFPDTPVIPYIIPGRTGAQMMPQDLAILAGRYSNVAAVKEATGDIENMKLTRRLCGEDFLIFSGDDALVFQIMTDPEIRASGAISVMSNIVPGAMSKMVAALIQGDIDAALKIQAAIKPLLDLVVVTTTEETPVGPVTCRARNPLPLKTLMQLLGMPSGPCRRPIGKMTPHGLDIIVRAAQNVLKLNSGVFEPIARFFDIDIEDRLYNPVFRDHLSYG